MLTKVHILILQCVTKNWKTDILIVAITVNLEMQNGYLIGTCLCEMKKIIRLTINSNRTDVDDR